MLDPTRRRLLASIHIAAKEAGMDDDTRRDTMMALVGARSCRDCDVAQLRTVVNYLRETFTPNHRPSKAQWCAVGLLAEQLGMDGLNDPRLQAFVCKTAKINNSRWLDKKGASKVIIGLRAWLHTKKRSV